MSGTPRVAVVAHAPAKATPFWAALALLSAVALSAWLSTDVRELVLALWSGCVGFAVSVNEAVVPAPLQSLAAKAAKVFLSPWLYLLTFMVYLAERYKPADADYRFGHTAMVHDFVAWFAVNSLLRVLFIGVFVSALGRLYESHLSFMTLMPAERWPSWLHVGAAVVVVDFFNWFHHWVRHKVPAFWVFHAVHHSQRRMSIFTDLRVHLAEYLVAKPLVILPVFVLGLNVEMAFWVILIRESYTRIIHANLRTDFGALRHVLVTPQSHRIHHSAEPEHADKNFGVIFCVWDKLFGTHWYGHTEYPETGIGDAAFPHETSRNPLAISLTYVRQVVYPFRCVWSGLRGRGWELTPTRH